MQSQSERITNKAIHFRPAAVAQQGVRRTNPHLVSTACGSMKDVYLSKKRVFIK